MFRNLLMNIQELSSKPRLVDASAVAEMAGLHEKTILRLARHRAIPSVRLSARIIRFSLDDVITALRRDFTKRVH